MPLILSRVFLSLILILFTSTAQSALSTENYNHLRSASLEILVNGQVQGSGWFADPQGLAITAAHLVRGNGNIEVLSPEFGRLSAKLIATDPGHDLALLKVFRELGFFPSLTLSEAPLAVGESVYAVGSPLSRHTLLIPGIAASDRSSYEWNDRNQCYTEINHFSAMTPQGLSGAPWVNEKGLVVGVQSGMILHKGSLGGIAFSVPVESVRSFLQKKSRPMTADLGGNFAEEWEGARSNAEKKRGLQILQVVAGGSLERAGIQSGENIIMVDRQIVTYRDELLRAINQRTVGELVKLKVVDQIGKERFEIVTLSGCPDFPTILLQP